MCTVLLPPGVKPITVNKYIIIYRGGGGGGLGFRRTVIITFQGQSGILLTTDGTMMASWKQMWHTSWWHRIRTDILSAGNTKARPAVWWMRQIWRWLCKSIEIAVQLHMHVGVENQRTTVNLTYVLTYLYKKRNCEDLCMPKRFIYFVIV